MPYPMFNYDGLHLVRKSAWKAPEISNMFCTLYERLIPLIDRSKHSFQAMEKTWVSLDSICLIIIGLTQVFDNKSHRPIQTKLTGAMNIGSGVQLLIIMILLAPVLPIACAVAAWNDLILSFEPLRHARNCCNDPAYWALDMELRINKAKTTDPDESTRLEDILSAYNITNMIPDDIQKELKKAYDVKALDTCIFAFSALGWSLLLVPVPGVQALAIVLLIVAAGMYMIKNADFLYKQMISICNMWSKHEEGDGVKNVEKEADSPQLDP